MSVEKIAETIRASSTTVRSELSRHGIERPVRRPPERPGYEAEMRRLYVRERLTIAQVAERLGINYVKAQKDLKRLGIGTRPTGPPAKVPGLSEMAIGESVLIVAAGR